jgi:hypothetical protein
VNITREERNINMNEEKIQLIVKIVGGAAVTTAIAFVVVKWLRKPKRLVTKYIFFFIKSELKISFIF